MIEKLKKITDYEIATPISGFRDFFLSDPLVDHEFDFIGQQDNKIYLKKDGRTLCYLDFHGDFFQGPDVRGGFTQLRPNANYLEQFREAMLGNRKVQVKEVEIKELEGTVAIISPHKFEGFPCYKVTGQRTEELYEELFSLGYKHILNVPTKISRSSLRLLKNLAEQYLPDKCQSIQIEGNSAGGEMNQLCYTNHSWRYFALSSDTWVKISNIMRDKTYNFESKLNKAFDENRFKRLSTAVSRTDKEDKSDSIRKKFEVI